MNGACQSRRSWVRRSAGWPPRPLTASPCRHRLTAYTTAHGVYHGPFGINEVLISRTDPGVTVSPSRIRGHASSAGAVLADAGVGGDSAAADHHQVVSDVSQFAHQVTGHEDGPVRPAGAMPVGLKTCTTVRSAYWLKNCRRAAGLGRRTRERSRVRIA